MVVLLKDEYIGKMPLFNYDCDNPAQRSLKVCNIFLELVQFPHSLSQNYLTLPARGNWRTW